MESYIIPKVVTCYIDNFLLQKNVWKTYFIRGYNIAKDFINLFCKDYEQMNADLYR